MKDLHIIKLWFLVSCLVFVPALVVIIGEASAQNPNSQVPVNKTLLKNQFSELTVQPVNKPFGDFQLSSKKIGQEDPIKTFLKVEIPLTLTAPPVPTMPQVVDLPLNDGVEDYNTVDEGVKRGVRRMGAWLIHEMNIHPVITSGRRSEKNNQEVKGSPYSWHLVGEAVDLGVGKLTPQQQARIKKKALEMGFEEVLYHNAGDGLHLHLAHMTRED